VLLLRLLFIYLFTIIIIIIIIIIMWNCWFFILFVQVLLVAGKFYDELGNLLPSSVLLCLILSLHHGLAKIIEHN